jgi:hypothetical protein
MTRQSPPGLNPGRTGHRALRYLAGGWATMRDLLAASVANPCSARGRRFPHLIHALIRDGLIVNGNGAYWLTPAGEAALAKLNAGQSLANPAPTMRRLEVAA